jgi:flagellar protein FliO/FliZ
MTKLNPLSRAVATAAAAAGSCLLVYACPPALAAAGKPKASLSSSESLPVNLGGSSSSTTSHVGGSGGSIVRTIVGLAIVIAVIWGLSWILRQVKSGRDPHTSSAGLTSLAALTLSTGRSVHLVKAGNDYLLLGSAEHGVVPIHRYTEEEAREAGLMDVIEVPGRSRRALSRGAGGGVLRAGGTSQQNEARQAGSRSGEEAARHDPMRMPAPGPGSSLVDRLRELTVRR